jgi:hypothetical protein
VPGERFELPTNGLQNRCSTTELTRLGPIYRTFCEEHSHQIGWLLPFCYPFVSRLFRAARMAPSTMAAASACMFWQDLRVKVERDPDLGMPKSWNARAARWRHSRRRLPADSQSVIVLQSRCAECGASFRFMRTEERVKQRAFSRRCELHKRPGVPVRAQQLAASVVPSRGRLSEPGIAIL